MAVFGTIPEHRISVFEFESVPSEHNERYVKSYYHIIDDVLPYHTHDFYEINIVYDGIGKHMFGDRDVLARAGDVFIIPPHTRHGYSCHRPMTVYHILLSNLFVAHFSELLRDMRGYGMLFDLEPMLRGRVDAPFYLRSKEIPFDVLKASIERIENCEQSFESERSAHVLSLIASLSESIYSARHLPTDDLLQNDIVSVIGGVEYIDAHFAEKISFKNLSEVGAMSYSTFLRCFKRLTGVTPVKYQLACRIRAASNMLISTDESILTVALESGFYDSSHFIREFVKEKGISPSEFRKKARAPKKHKR